MFKHLKKVSVFIHLQEAQHGQQATPDEKHNEMIKDIFNHEDKDRDGFISHEEFSGPKHDEL